MRLLYILLTVAGTLLPNIFVLKETFATGNYMLYRYPWETFQAMFASNISSAFVTDLMLLVIYFLVWSLYDAKKRQVKHLWVTWLYTFLLGLAGGLPLYLYMRERAKSD